MPVRSTKSRWLASVAGALGPVSIVWSSSLLSGACLAAAFQPGWGALTWVALVPFAAMMGRERRGDLDLYLGAYYGGVVFHLIGLQWLRTGYSGLMFQAWIVVAHIAALSWPVALAIGRRLVLRRGLPLALALPVCWTAAEYLRYHASAIIDGNGFPFLQAGMTLGDLDPLMQAADLGGVPIVGWLVLGVNGFLGDLWASWARRLLTRELALSFALAALPCLLAWAYGTWRLAEVEAVAGPIVALIPGELEGQDVAATAARIEKMVADVVATIGRPDLLVWQEYAYAGHVSDELRGVPAPMADEAARANALEVVRGRSRPVEERRRATRVNMDFLEQLSRRLGIALAVGCSRADFAGGDRLFNSLALVTPGGGYQASYDKSYLGPGVEFIPERARAIGLIPTFWARRWADLRLSGTMSGRTLRVFDLPTKGREQPYHFSSPICYDVHFAALHRDLVRSARAATGRSLDFFIGPADEPPDFGEIKSKISTLTHARFRAVECRTPYLREVQGGQTAIIDGCGRVLQRSSGIGSEQRVLAARVPLDGRPTLFLLGGDWVSYLACFLSATLSIRPGLSARWLSRAPDRPGRRNLSSGSSSWR